MYHIIGGNDQLVERLAAAAGCVIQRQHVVRAVQWNDQGVRVSIQGPSGRVAVATADYVVLAVPVPLLREVKFTPSLPEVQQRALQALDTGPATKALLRFATPWWRQPRRPRAFGSNLAVGAVWDASEAQPGAAILSVLAGGRASAGLQTLIEKQGAVGVAQQLQWLNRKTRAAKHGVPIPAMHAVTWERDPWARGAYAYFSPRFDPALRPLLARAAGRVFFAGCHTSREYQGYMNGAIESGVRVAEEIASASTLA
jgi:monoamine oxidase